MRTHVTGTAVSPTLLAGGSLDAARRRIYSYARADNVEIEAVVAAGAKGIVMAGVGRGGTTGSQNGAMRRAAAKGVIIVTSTRTGSGAVSVRSGNSIGSGDLNSQKARVLLALTPRKTSDRAEIRKIFAEYQ